MTSAQQGLLASVYSVVAADAGLGATLAGGKVYDQVPRGAAFPFVRLGAFTTESLDSGVPPTERHRFDIQVFSRANGRAEVLAIAARLEALLHHAALTVSGYVLTVLRLRETTVAAGRDRRSYRARLRFEAVTEKE